MVERDGRQAIAVAFQIDPHSAATLGDVAHVIGPYDYGVVHSNTSVDAVTRNLWPRPELAHDRSFEVDYATELVHPDGRRDPVTVHGTVQFSELSAASIDPSVVMRDDAIVWSGSGVIAASSYRSADGTEHPAPSSNPFGWRVDSQLVLDGDWATGSVRLGLQRLLHRAAESITRPFELWTAAEPPTLATIRLDGTSHHCLFVGALP